MFVAMVLSGDELEQVIALWRRESSTLGFFPLGAFDDAQQQNRIIIEKIGAQVVGYLLFRLTKEGTAAIVHLCVARERRGTGLPDILMNRLRKRVDHCTAITLSCRRDFQSASATWRRLGFIPVGEISAQTPGAVLTQWRLELRAPPLLQLLSQPAAGVVRVVIDANVFFDLVLDDGNEESKGLMSDWLAGFIQLAVTPELLNEIDRRDSAIDRETNRRRASQFAQITRNSEREQQALQTTLEILPSNGSPSADSDARQLSMAAASSAPYFCTRDRRILEAADEIDRLLGIEVVAPYEVVLRFDELRRTALYRPRRLFLGPQLTSGRATHDDVQAMVEAMHDGQPAPEPKLRTAARLKTLLSDPSRFEANVMRSDGALLAAWVLERANGELRVPFFCAAANRLGATAARHHAWDFVRIAAREVHNKVVVTPAGNRIDEALADTGFVRNQDVWVRRLLRGVHSQEALSEALHDPNEATPDLSESPFSLERRFWPLKLRAQLPCFIVPIRPSWAASLFDTRLANGTLFGADHRIALNVEGAYFRTPQPRLPKPEARVLWYVSHHREWPETKTLRAASLVTEVVVDQARHVSRRYGRLGAYKWNDVLKVAGNRPDGRVLGFLFDHTELLERPVAWDEIQKTLEKSGQRRNQFTSPVEISEECFFALYQLGQPS